MKLWGPLTEIPRVGRNIVYIPTLFIFVALQVPTALAGNLGTLLSTRFLGGFFASPCLAIGGASIIDLFEPKDVPYCLGIWGALAALCQAQRPILGRKEHRGYNPCIEAGELQ